MFFTTGIFSCKKQQLLTSGGTLAFSTDTLTFDTVFTAAGSFTTGLVIYNRQSDPIVVSSVRLEKGSGSYFHLNVDGYQGNNITNLHIAPHDSIYVFATVNIDPTNVTTPFIVTDRLIATLNNQDFSIPFTAYGQNAHYIVSDSLVAANNGTSKNNWDTILPYVVLHHCAIGSGAVLNIPPRCKVYMHQDARFFVYGTLNVGQTATQPSDSTIFQGDRLDRAYFGYVGYPGEWGGIYVIGGGTANINKAIIKNCGGSTPYYGYSIQPAALEVDSGGVLNITNSIVKNSIGHGLLGFQGSINATNCLVEGCGGEAFAVILGGKDSITSCTFANFGSNVLSHTNNPTVGVVNWLQLSLNEYIYSNVDVVMRNCIIWGSLDSEMVCDTSGSPAGTNARLLFDHCVVKKGTQVEAFAKFNSCVYTDPLFKDASKEDFHLPVSSPAVGTGTSNYLPAKDLEGTNRVPSGSGGYDIGCYQHSN